MTNKKKGTGFAREALEIIKNSGRPKEIVISKGKLQLIERLGEDYHTIFLDGVPLEYAEITEALEPYDNGNTIIEISVKEKGAKKL